MNRTLVVRVRCLLLEAKLPNTFWAEALNTVAYVINLSPAVALDGDVPDRVWFAKDVSYDHLRVFGSKVCVHVPKDERSKLDVKTKQCIFIGYGQDEFGCRFYDPTIEDIDKAEKIDSLSNESLVYIDLVSIAKAPIAHERTQNNNEDTDQVQNDHHGVDVMDAPVDEVVVDQQPNPAQISSIRVVLGLAASLDLEVEQMDVKTAFLHGDLDEEIYMEQHEDFIDKHVFCRKLAAFKEGQQVHKHVIQSGFGSNPFIQTSLLNLYAKCEEIGLAEKVFDEIPERNVVAWSAMISRYSRLGMVNESLSLFREMQKTGVSPDKVTMVSVISACAMSGELDLGRWVHAYIDRRLIENDLELSTALVNMYAKCGCIEKAIEVFEAMPVKDAKAWSSMIVSLAINGLAEYALVTFSRMDKAKVEPNHVTLVGVLMACAHSGLVFEGKKYWASMIESGIEPSLEYYGCMVNLLSRSNLIDEAYSFVEAMPLTLCPAILRTLLVGCKKNKILDKGEILGQHLIELESSNAENYILLSSLYASGIKLGKNAPREKNSPFFLEDRNTAPFLRLEKDTAMRPLTSDEEALLPISKPMKVIKRKRASNSEGQEPKKRKTRKPKGNTIPLSMESVQRLRDKEDEGDSGLMAHA
uniref:Pentatricopeptide repeat-containing protein At2g02980, chloroplastic-like n=1 Tax=Nicotiana tabacum TaxID=4097 RepID=A0A1S3ZLH2_TOBAC|nr:PREDICTED: pentatricopeptide repeat-containing protein At2g02980, chloroplastic-like [Nicotiana tabacum]